MVEVLFHGTQEYMPQEYQEYFAAQYVPPRYIKKKKKMDMDSK